MKIVIAIVAVVTLFGFGSITQANVFNLGAGFTNLETVTVGDPGNAADTSYEYQSFGSVGYTYNIGKYEVTAKQYTDFLNAKAQINNYSLYNSSMWSDSYGCKIQRSGSGILADPYTYSVADDYANRPVNYVGYWDACRFANWLSNGQGNGSTETGTYTLNGYNSNGGASIQRNAGATWAVTSEDEWYKAAYYKSGGINAGYWDYATRSNTAPANQVLGTDPGNSANYYNNNYTIGCLTNVGEFENSASAYGTFDQGGNVLEWNEAIVCKVRGLRGGSLASRDYELQALYRSGTYLTNECYNIGFRVSEVPEPSSIIALFGGLISLIGISRRRV